ncbi:hypothetical protein GCM10027061_30070 [Nesterenkonia suensis]
MFPPPSTQDTPHSPHVIHTLAGWGYCYWPEVTIWCEASPTRRTGIGWLRLRASVHSLTCQTDRIRASGRAELRGRLEFTAARRVSIASTLGGSGDDGNNVIVRVCDGGRLSTAPVRGSGENCIGSPGDRHREGNHDPGAIEGAGRSAVGGGTASQVSCMVVVILPLPGDPISPLRTLHAG